jgi:hypothetical protein
MKTEWETERELLILFQIITPIMSALTKSYLPVTAKIFFILLFQIYFVTEN